MILSSCGKDKVGETGQSIKVRIHEHITNIKHNCTHPYVLSKHSDKTKHHIFIEDTKILARIDRYHYRKYREAIQI
jgi:hypothetical protein